MRINYVINFSNTVIINLLSIWVLYCLFNSILMWSLISTFSYYHVIYVDGPTLLNYIITSRSILDYEDDVVYFVSL